MVDSIETWAGNLSDNTYAVLLLNRASVSSKIDFSLKDLGLNTSSKFQLRDLWLKKDIGIYDNTYSVYLDSHDSQLFKVILDFNEEEKEDDIFVQIIVMISLAVVIAISIGVSVYMYIDNRKKNKGNNEEKDKLIDNDNN